MDAEKMTDFILEFQENDPANRISTEVAKRPEYTGKKIFDGLALGVAAADDPIFASLKNNKEANLDMIMPEEWLPGARTVLSFFMPFAHWITEENIGYDMPSCGWLHGRIEGQAAINKLNSALAEELRKGGYETVSPALDPGFNMYEKSADGTGPEYTSNWSERHVAYIAGLGTFGLSRGIITRLGTAGRMFSLVTVNNIEPTPRAYNDLLEYCTRCLACNHRCPVGAISIENLKDHAACCTWVNEVKEKKFPYYGCGKCQCGVPCSFGIPKKMKTVSDTVPDEQKPQFLFPL